MLRVVRLRLNLTSLGPPDRPCRGLPDVRRDAALGSLRGVSAVRPVWEMCCGVSTVQPMGTESRETASLAEGVSLHQGWDLRYSA